MEKENFILKLAEYQDKRKKKREDILEKYNKLNFKIDSICDADTGAIFLTDEDSVIKRKKLINHPIFKIFDIDCIEAHRKYTLNLNDKVILRGPDNYYFGFCYLGDLDVRCSEIVETLNGIKLLITIDKPETDPIDKLLGIIKKKTDIEIIKVPSVIIIKSIIFSLVNILITDIKYIIINELWEYILVILDSEHAK